jgi:hypothetical protein
MWESNIYPESDQDDDEEGDEPTVGHGRLIKVRRLDGTDIVCSFPVGRRRQVRNRDTHPDMGTGRTVCNEWGHAVGETALAIAQKSVEALRSLVGNGNMPDAAHLSNVHPGPPQPIPQDNQDIQRFSRVVVGYAPGGINARRPNAPPPISGLPIPLAIR